MLDPMVLLLLVAAMTYQLVGDTIDAIVVKVTCWQPTPAWWISLSSRWTSRR